MVKCVIYWIELSLCIFSRKPKKRIETEYERTKTEKIRKHEVENQSFLFPIGTKKDGICKEKQIYECLQWSLPKFALTQ